MSRSAEVMEKIVALCRRRGFIFGSSEIYGGIGGFWDYGPLGTELKRNIKDVWWHDMVTNPPTGPDGHEVSMVGLDCAIIMNPKVWEASGHARGFADPMVDCKETKARYRADKAWVVGFCTTQDIENKRDWARRFVEIKKQLNVSESNLSDTSESDLDALETRISAYRQEWQSEAHTVVPRILYAVEADNADEARHTARSLLTKRQRKKISYPFVDFAFNHLQIPSSWPKISPATQRDTLTEPRSFNLMFKTFVGALEDASALAWLRPETAQGIFANFKNVMDSTRVKIPFGIAQIGKAFRNEINPRNYTFRSREFEQMEIEFFCHPKDSMMWYEFWRDNRLKWYESLGIKSERLRPREQGEEELAHYSEACTDVEYVFPFSDEPQELEGIAHRGDFDLKAHGKMSKDNENTFAVLDEETKERYVPHVIEPSAGVDRFALAAICEAYTVDESRPSPELLNFHPRLAPIKAAVFPLVNKDGMPAVAEGIYGDIKRHYICQFDVKQSIGKRYARMDEAGTPYCFTVDGQTLDDGTVTVRDRDTGLQVRIDKSTCLDYLQDKLHF